MIHLNKVHREIHQFKIFILTHFDFYFGSNFDNNKNDFLSVKDKEIALTYNFIIQN